MDKKSPEQQKPEGIDSKLTDAEGNRAEMLDLRNRTLSPFPHLSGSPSSRTAMLGERMGPGNSNPLGIESIMEREVDLFKEYANETLTDDQKMALSILGEIIGGSPDNYQTGVMTLTLAVPILTDKETPRLAALRKLFDETPPGSICGHWKYPTRGSEEHQVSISIGEDGDTSKTTLLFREYPTVIGDDTSAKEQQLRSLADSHPVCHDESVLNSSVFYDDAFSPLSLATIREPLPAGYSNFKRYAKYNGHPATLKTQFVEIDGVRAERLLAMTLFSSGHAETRTVLFDLEHGKRQFVLVKVNN